MNLDCAPSCSFLISGLSGAVQGNSQTHDFSRFSSAGGSSQALRKTDAMLQGLLPLVSMKSKPSSVVSGSAVPSSRIKQAPVGVSSQISKRTLVSSPLGQVSFRVSLYLYRLIFSPAAL